MDTSFVAGHHEQQPFSRRMSNLDIDNIDNINNLAGIDDLQTPQNDTDLCKMESDLPSEHT